MRSPPLLFMPRNALSRLRACTLCPNGIDRSESVFLPLPSLLQSKTRALACITTREVALVSPSHDLASGFVGYHVKEPAAIRILLALAFIIAI